MLNRIAMKINRDGWAKAGVAASKLAWRKCLGDRLKAASWTLSMRATLPEVTFPDEGGVTIRLPNLSIADAFRAGGAAMARRCGLFVTRPNHEVLLRTIIYRLYDAALLDRRKSIIDIGSWIADNALVWSRFLDAAHARVYAIDPSFENIEFGNTLAKINNITNIAWRQAVCDDQGGKTLCYEGPMDQCSFNTAGRGYLSKIKSTTVDDLIGPRGWSEIGLMHVDVEGFEHFVLRGSINILTESRPFIVFEQHICHDDLNSLSEFLGELGYEIFMVNEVLPGCNLDCRNFLALPRGTNIPTRAEEWLSHPPIRQAHWAIPGPWLVALH